MFMALSDFIDFPDCWEEEYYETQAYPIKSATFCNKCGCPVYLYKKNADSKWWILSFDDEKEFHYCRPIKKQQYEEYLEYRDYTCPF